MLKKGKEQSGKKKDTLHHVSSLCSRERRIFRSDHDPPKWIRPGNVQTCKTIKKGCQKNKNPIF